MHRAVRSQSEEVYGVKPVTYAQILEFDKKIQDLEKQVPAPYRFDASSTYDTIEQPVRALRCFVAHVSRHFPSLILTVAHTSRANREVLYTNASVCTDPTFSAPTSTHPSPFLATSVFVLLVISSRSNSHQSAPLLWCRSTTKPCAPVSS